MKINLIAPFKDPTGYGEFARYFGYALDKNGYDVSCENILLSSSSTQPIDFGIKGVAIANKYTINPQNCDCNIIFMIPRLFQMYKRKQSKFNIGFSMFEADLLPNDWVKNCNSMDAIFVPSQWNKETFAKSGVIKPIFVISPGILEEEYKLISNHDDKILKFYTIAQPSYRKNIDKLLISFLSEFSEDDNVQLNLKLISLNLNLSIEEANKHFKVFIKDIKERCGVSDKMLKKINHTFAIASTQQMINFHRHNDCFISFHKGEGWGMGMMEAMALEKTVIATNYSGNTQFMTKSNSILLDYMLEPCVKMDTVGSFFNCKMSWAEPSSADLKKAMRAVYNKEINTGARARADILEKFNPTTSSDAMIKAILELENFIK